MKKQVQAKPHSLLLDLITDFLGGLLVAIGTYNFAASADFPVSGVSGIAVVFYHYLKWPIGTMTFLMNLPILIICGRILGLLFVLRSVRTMLISSIATDVIAPLLPMYQGNLFFATMCCGIISGIGYALIYSRDTSTGGTDFIMMSVQKKNPDFTLGKISFVIDSAVLVFNGVLMKAGIKKLFFALIGSAAMCVVIDRSMPLLSGIYHGNSLPVKKE